MRSTLLLASLLAVVLFTSATDFLPGYTIPYGPSFIEAGCHALGGLTGELDTKNPTVEACITTCSTSNYTQAGVSNTYCYCDSATDGGKKALKSFCQQYNCTGDAREWCGSDLYLVLYQKSSN